MVVGARRADGVGVRVEVHDRGTEIYDVEDVEPVFVTMPVAI